MFKVGQIVTVKELGIYNITDYMKPLEVISSSNHLSKVKPLWESRTIYTLENSSLRVMLESEILHKGDIIKVNDKGTKISVEFLRYNDFDIYVRTEKGFVESYSMRNIFFDEIEKKGLYVKI